MVLVTIFSALRSPDKLKKLQGARELRDTVSSVSRESPKNSTRLNQDVNKHIFELIRSPDAGQRLGGILAIDQLIQCDPAGDNSDFNATRFAHYLRQVLLTPDIEVIKAAASAIGRLTKSGSLAGDLVEYEVKRCVEWLTLDRQEIRRHAAALELKAIALNSPTLIFTFMTSIIEALWFGIRDQKLAIRQDSVKALGVCLEIVVRRDKAIQDQIFSFVWREATFGVTAGQVESMQGSLLVFRELVRHAGNFMRGGQRYSESMSWYLKLRDHKDHQIRRTVVEAMPDFASYNSYEFGKHYLGDVMQHMSLLLQREKGPDKAIVFLAVGQISLSVKAVMAPYLDIILAQIKETLSAKTRVRREQESAIFRCLGMFAAAFGQAFTKHLDRSLLALIFNCGFTKALYECLSSLFVNIPALREDISDWLLDIISHGLCGYSFRPPGGPSEQPQRVSETIAHEYRETMLAKMPGEADDQGLVTAFLTILIEFDFQNRILAPFCRDCVMKYTDNPDPSIRKAAALSCAAVFVREPVCQLTSTHSLEMVQQVLQRLLIIGVTDSQYDIRLDVLRALDPKEDAHLSQPENTRLLFMAINDEVFAIRQVALGILGRLSRVNPAYVVPQLRKTMIDLLTDLEYSSNTRGKEESARLLGVLMKESSNLVQPYVDPILKVLVPTARSAVSTVSASVMDAAGDLCNAASGKLMLKHIPELMPIIVDMLQDQASVVRRDTALQTLGKLASNCEYVIDPYYQYPNLLSVLIKILVSDPNQTIQRETVRLLGILGALDPYKARDLSADDVDDGQQAVPIDVKIVLKGTPPSSEDYNPTVVVSSLMALLKDPAMAANHTRIVQAILRIFESLGLKCVLFLDEVIPGLIQSMNPDSLPMVDLLFRQISTLTSVVKQHIRPFLNQIFGVANTYFKYTELHPAILTMIESVAKALDGEFKMYMPSFLPSIIGILQSDDSDSIPSKIRVLDSLYTFGSNLEEYLHLIVPNVVGLFYFSPLNLRLAALRCISDLCQLLDLSDMTSRIVHPLIRILNNSNEDQVRQTCIETLSNVAYQLGSDYAVFIESVHPSIQRVRGQLNVATYEKIVSRILKSEPLPPHLNPYTPHKNTGPEATPSEQNARLQMNQNLLKITWDTTGRSTRDDWSEWFRRLSVEFLKQSPSPAMRACADIAVVSPTLARDLFNPSFYTVWTQIFDEYKEDLLRNVQTAMASQNIPPEVLQTLLTLAEFMERDDKPFPLPARILAGYAQKCHAYAKALHYKEMEFISDPSSATIESLISINNQLQQSDAAIGILKHAQHHHSLQLKETWYEKLQRWEEALAAYREREKYEPDSMEVVMGKMRCLHALGEWDQLANIAKDKWRSSSMEARRVVAPLAAAAAWGLGEWEQMDTYVAVIKADSPDRSFFNSILSLHRADVEQTAKQIQRARDQLIPELTALVSESYNRAYGVIVRVQMLAELEEIMRYKMLPESARDERANLRRTWEKRLMGCQHNVDIWQRILNIRTLVLEPKQNMKTWIKFANLCRKSNRIGLAEKSLNMLLDHDQHATRAPPQVVYAQLKFMWATGNQQDALRYLVDFTTRMSHDLNLSGSDDLISQPLPWEAPGSAPEIKDYTKLLARCFLKQGEWQIALNARWKAEPERKASIMGSYLLATHFDRAWYKAWHNWAIANFEVVSVYEKQRLNDEQIAAYVIPAIRGFFHSITLANKSALQDTLRLLTLWFKYGGTNETAKAIQDGFQMVQIENWLEVVPQLISRIHQTNPVVRESLHGLLTDLGKKHPQALVYPLQVSIKSENEFRKHAAQRILDQMKLYSARSSVLVEQAELVSHELIRVAVLWDEQWYEGLEDASRCYFVDKNIPKMFTILDSLHQTLADGPTTLREMSFQNLFGRDLNEAWEWDQTYKRTHDEAHLNQAWDIYYNVFRRLTRQLTQSARLPLDLQYVSPRLQQARNLRLVVPGTYEPGKPEVTITSFDPTFYFISSKQWPRRFKIHGSDGKDYQYLLKGHEDLRQDSLVMQLFGLVNTLLASNPECFKRHLAIRRYAVIPLSPKAGLLGWVQNSDTLNYLIKEYREGRSLTSIETRIMMQMAQDYDSLTHLQKIEVFTYALDNTKGQDLYRILWLKSRSSEAWLNRRTEYTRSLAVMSMVGYILGLGDRHPSNLMLDRITGTIVHIDFGDCFEAAILREKFPEKVPFRLTRMLTYAMEVSGVEGSFRITSEHVMSLLRANSESLMAILEAFANDPLINWGFDIPRRSDNDDSLSPALLAQPVGTSEDQGDAEHRSLRAQLVLHRISDKLTGNDIRHRKNLNVPDQVDLLIQEATNIENLCLHFVGWCAFW